MAKRVVIIASGETERRALPHLARHLQEHSVAVDEVRIPPRNRALNAQMAEKLIKAAWYENLSTPPDKFVVLMDVDRARPDDVLTPIRNQLPRRVAKIEANVLYAYAQEHLEAWYFADAGNLSKHLDRDPGQVDTSRPDEIQNPKLHLRHLLGDRVYTARVSEEIAMTLNPGTIAGRSPSFRKFVDAVMNGGTNTPEEAPARGSICVTDDVSEAPASRRGRGVSDASRE